MKKLGILCGSLLIFSPIKSITQELIGTEAIMYENAFNHLRKKEGIDPKTQNILARFADIMMHFFGIVQNPKNAHNVADNVAGMITGTIQLITEAVQRGELSLDATDEEIYAYAATITRMMQPALKDLPLYIE